MSYRTFHLLAAAVLLATPALVMCSSTPDPTPEDLVPEFDTSPDDTAEAFESATPWLAEDSYTVAVAARPGMWDFAEVAPLLTDETGLESGQPGTNEALRADIEDAMRDALGFDPADVDAFAVGYSDTALTAVLFGDFGPLQDLSEVEVEGEDRILYQFNEGLAGPTGNLSDVLLLPIDAPRPGIAIADSAEVLTALANGEGSLAASDRRQEYDAFFGHDNMTFAAASLLEEFYDRHGDTAPVPDAAGISYGARLTFDARGDDDTLSQIEEAVQMGQTMLVAETERILDDPNAPVFERLFATVGHHFGVSLSTRVHHERHNDILHYQFDLIDIDGHGDSPYDNPLIPTLATVVLIEELERMNVGSPHGPDPSEVEEYTLPSSE